MSNTPLDDTYNEVLTRSGTLWLLPGPAWEILGQLSLEPIGHGTLHLYLDSTTLEIWLNQANASPTRQLTKKLSVHRSTTPALTTPPAPPPSGTRARPKMTARHRASPSPRVFAQLHWDEPA